MTTVPTRSPRPSAAAPTAVAALSLVATAAMWADYPLVPPLIWLALLLAVAVSCAASTRRARDRHFPLRSHLAVEPFAMALMVVLGMLHGHGSETASATSTALATAAVATDPTAHTAHLGWLTAAIALAVAALAVACPVLAIRHALRVGAVRAALPLAASIAMAIMAARMLLPA